MRQGTKVVWTNSARSNAASRKLLWITPAKGGTFSVELTATDLAGNFSTAERHGRGQPSLAPAPPPRLD